MDCRHARFLLDFARPRGTELEPTETEALESHLVDCPECGVLAGYERQADEHIGRAMRDVPVPDGLHMRLVRRLTVERDAWYRRWVLRAAGMLAAAAVLFLVVWGVVLWHDSRQPLDLTDVYADERPTNTPRDVEEWFGKSHGLRTVAPSDHVLDYTWLTYYDLEEFQGRRVPMLLFAYTRPEIQARAKVYIVTDRQFEGLGRLVNRVHKLSGGYSLEVIRSADAAGTYYVVVYTDGSRSRFFRKQPLAT